MPVRATHDASISIASTRTSHLFFAIFKTSAFRLSISCIPLGFIYGQYTGLRRLCQVMLVKIYVKAAPNVVFVV